MAKKAKQHTEWVKGNEGKYILKGDTIAAAALVAIQGKYIRKEDTIAAVTVAATGSRHGKPISANKKTASATRLIGNETQASIFCLEVQKHFKSVPPSFAEIAECLRIHPSAVRKPVLVAQLLKERVSPSLKKQPKQSAKKPSPIPLRPKKPKAKSKNAKAKCSICGSLVLLARLEAHILQAHTVKRPGQFEQEILGNIGELVRKPGRIYFEEFERYLFAKHHVQVKVSPSALLGALIDMSRRRIRFKHISFAYLEQKIFEKSQKKFKESPPLTQKPQKEVSQNNWVPTRVHVVSGGLPGSGKRS